jgi:hypothetical protein
MLAWSVLTLAASSIEPASAAPINATAKTGIGPACFLSGSAVQNCRNVLNFKTYYECRRQRDGAGLE